MEGLREFLDVVRRHQLVKGHLRALLHVAVGREIRRVDGTLLSKGVTWRELAELLRQLRWDKELVRELGLDPDALAPRDRQRYWYQAINAAALNAPECVVLGNDFARMMATLGYVVGPAPGT